MKKTVLKWILFGVIVAGLGSVGISPTVSTTIAKTVSEAVSDSVDVGEPESLGIAD